MNIVNNIESLLGRNMTPDEVIRLNRFQKEFHIDDDDPMMVVLAIMARSQIILDAAPNLLQQKVNETIELHRSVLREQAVLVIKDLIGVLASDIEKVTSKNNLRWVRDVGFFIGGMLVFGLLKALLRN